MYHKLSRVVGSAVLLAVCLLCVGAQDSSARSRKASPLWAGVLALQPSDGTHGTRITWTDSIWVVRDHDSTVQVAKAISVADSSDGGTVMVHMWEAPDSVWITLRLAGGTHRGYLFDMIHQPRATADTIPRRDIIVWY